MACLESRPLRLPRYIQQHALQQRFKSPLVRYSSRLCFRANPYGRLHRCSAEAWCFVAADTGCRRLYRDTNSQQLYDALRFPSALRSSTRLRRECLRRTLLAAHAWERRRRRELLLQTLDGALPVKFGAHSSSSVGRASRLRIHTFTAPLHTHFIFKRTSDSHVSRTALGRPQV